MYTYSDTENGHDKARWVHLRSVHGYTVYLTLDVSRRLKVDHFGHWNNFYLSVWHSDGYAFLRIHLNVRFVVYMILWKAVFVIEPEWSYNGH